MAERPKFQFRMRDVLWAVSLIGVAAGLAALLWRRYQQQIDSMAVEIILGVLAAGFLGAGLGCVFRRPLIGAGVTIFAAFALWIAIVVLLFCDVLPLGDTL